MYHKWTVLYFFKSKNTKKPVTELHLRSSH